MTEATLQVDGPKASELLGDAPVKLALPKGRMQEGVIRLLGEAGIDVRMGSRSYRPTVNLAGVDAKMLKPQSIVEMLGVGSRDVGFAGADWVAELGAELVELVDTGMDPVKLVAAAPEEILRDGGLPKRPLVVASEYRNLTSRWIAQQGLDARFVHSWGATEVLPPEDADCIVDNTATGSTLRANGLHIVDTLMTSSTRLYASPQAMAQPHKREGIERLVLLVTSVIEARQRVMVELNVGREQLKAIIAVLPCMREPTIASLHAEAGYAVKAAVPRNRLTTLIPALKAHGATDIVVTNLSQIIP